MQVDNFGCHDKKFFWRAGEHGKAEKRKEKSVPIFDFRFSVFALLASPRLCVKGLFLSNSAKANYSAKWRAKSEVSSENPTRQKSAHAIISPS
jgi:hypothetical protein